MKHYKVEVVFRGRVFINIEAENEDEATERACDEFESRLYETDDFYDVDVFVEESRD